MRETATGFNTQMRRTGGFSRPATAVDPMAQTLQKWRESVREMDDIENTDVVGIEDDGEEDYNE